MTENQKLREALQAISHIDDTTNHSVDASAALDRIGQIARQALALPTAAPVDERERFEQFAQNCPMGKYNVTRRGEGYDSSHTQIMWDAWQARAALIAGDAVDAQRLDFIEEHCRCDPKMDGQHVWWPTSFNTAQLLKGPTLREAIDNAIRARKDNT